MSEREAARLVRVTKAPTIPGVRFRGYADPA
jgi:hypothetical protein